MESSLADNVAGQVRAEMARARVSGVRLAAQLGKSHAYVSRRLTGVVPFNVDELERIAALLDVPVERFLRGHPDELAASRARHPSTEAGAA